MRKIPKDFQRIVDSVPKISRQPESTDSERIIFDLRRGKRELPTGSCSFLPTNCLGKIRTKPCRLTAPDCAQLRRFENQRRFDQVCVNVRTYTWALIGTMTKRSEAASRRCVPLSRSNVSETCVRRKMARRCDDDRASRVYSYQRSNERALTSLSDDRSFDRNYAFPSLPSSSWIRKSIANEDKKYDVSNNKSYSMTVTVSFLIYAFCSSNHASTKEKVDCVYQVRTARARLELSVLSSFLKSQAEASRERKRKRSRSAR